MQRIIQMREAEMSALDTDGDGKLEMEELLSSVPAKFTAMDTNGDGFLDTKEIIAYMMAFEKDYADLYGETLEFHAQRMLRHLELADDNADGRISRDEFTAYMTRRYQAFDRNRDGIVSDDEYKIDSERL